MGDRWEKKKKTLATFELADKTVGRTTYGKFQAHDEHDTLDPQFITNIVEDSVESSLSLRWTRE